MVLILVTNVFSPPQVICVAENEETGGTSPRLDLALVLSCCHIQSRRHHCHHIWGSLRKKYALGALS